MGTYAGIDLHSSNNYIGIMDQDHKRMFGRRLPNSLDKILIGMGVTLIRVIKVFVLI